MTANTYTATVHIAGDMATIRDTCRRFCLRGACVSVVEADYIYTGGAESGAAITIINYPRFESTPERIAASARDLALMLLESCHQRSCSVVCSDVTEYIENPAVKIPR